MTEVLDRNQRVAWQPDDAVRARAQLTRFMSACGVDSFEELHKASIEDIEWFTDQLLRFLGIQFNPPYRQVMDISSGIEWPRWCVDGGLNIAASCTDRFAGTSHGTTPAVVWEGETGEVRRLTYDELHGQVERCAAGLRSIGFKKGNAIGIFLPMIPETVVALLAAARIGAIAVPLFSGYGPAAIESRMRDVGAKALITCDAFPRRGRLVPAKAIADEALSRCPDLAHMIVVRCSGIEVWMQAGRDIAWHDLLLNEKNTEPANTNAEDYLIVLYTSGTTGRPKGIVHTHCGFPIKAAQDMAFGTDVGPGDRIAWITDLGWMMGPWLIYGATLLGATIVLYDGAPDYPGADRLWQFCAAHRVEILGISPTLVRSLAIQGDELPAAHDLSSLRILASTGEPWNPDPWWWLFEKVGQSRVPIINYSGGTEISGGILMGNPLVPLKPCSFPAPCPGIAADVVDDEARSVRGSVGELVIRQPWIGMARGFWNNPHGYLETYWSRWPNIWVHGDWARRDDDGHWYILGRSDDTLKIAGKRIGPAEVESILVAHEEVVEAAVVGVPDEVKGNGMVAFCVLKDGAQANDELAEELRTAVAAELGKPLRPDKIVFVSQLPKTRNAKVMRRVVRAVYLSEDPGDLTALENPAALDSIRQAAQ